MTQVELCGLEKTRPQRAPRFGEYIESIQLRRTDMADDHFSPQIIPKTIVRKGSYAEGAIILAPARCQPLLDCCFLQVSCGQIRRLFNFKVFFKYKSLYRIESCASMLSICLYINAHLPSIHWCCAVICSPNPTLQE